MLGTERHEARRIDNQLRGRSGRQGDPGESRFYLSLEDELMRRFQGERVQGLMRRLRVPEDVPIEHSMVTKSIERAQRQVESQNFEIRKNVLKYDEVMNRQREVVYTWRTGVLRGDDPEPLLRGWIDQVVTAEVEDVDQRRDLPRGLGLGGAAEAPDPDLPDPPDPRRRSSPPRRRPPTSPSRFCAEAQEALTARTVEFGPALMRRLCQTVVLSMVDAKWREHLAEMDYLRAGISLRAMGQRDPLVEYQREAYDMFSDMVDSLRRDAVRIVFHAQVVEQSPRRWTRWCACRAPAGPPSRSRPRPRTRSGATIPAPAAPGRSTSAATGRCPPRRRRAGSGGTVGPGRLAVPEACWQHPNAASLDPGTSLPAVLGRDSSACRSTAFWATGPRPTPGPRTRKSRHSSPT